MTLYSRLLLAPALLAVSLSAQPALEPLDEPGYQRMLAANKGKVLLVDFWATWCQPCRVEMPLLVKLEASLRARGFKLVTISADEPEQEAIARKFLAETAVPGKWYVKRPKSDSAFIEAVDPRWSGALPAMYLYDRTGRKRQMFVGETAMATIEAAIGKLL
jgi:thiol-disulfide isomerase/thioredoxin